VTLADERENLAKAERDISAGERRVAAQEVLVERLRRDGHSVREAEGLLLTLRQTLTAWMGHRDEILRQIARLERDAAARA